MATKTNRAYARCQKHLETEEVAEKTQAVGDKAYVIRVPTAGTLSKLQSAYIGPFRVVDTLSDVRVKERNIRTGAAKTLHTSYT